MAPNFMEAMGRRREPRAPSVAGGSASLDDDEVVQALRNAHGAVHALLQTSLADTELIPTEYRALAHLFRRGELTLTALSTALEITPASTTELVDRLEARHLVRRSPNPTDRRSMLVRLTPKGKSAYEAARTVYRRSVARVSGRMTKAGRNGLVHGIGEFLRVFRSSADTGPGHAPTVVSRRSLSR
jgi:DNA-binding MarR family transcriptional regulator